MHETADKIHDPNRIAYLDGLRCFSILSVVLYHYFSGWAMPDGNQQIYPYGNMLSAPFQHGHFGVQFFFMISGLVIMMTLNRCKTWWEFAIRRAARLVPAMILFSILSFVTVQLFAPNIFQVSALSFIPAWLFITPAFLNRMFETSTFSYIDSAYWSLCIEVQFYVTICALYFLSGKNFYRNALVFFAACFAIADLSLAFGMQTIYDALGFITSPDRFPWFMIGIGFYIFSQSGSRFYCAAFITLGVIQSLLAAIPEPSTAKLIAPIILPLMFFAVMNVASLQRFLSWKPFTTLGVASYGLYLVHQNVGVLLIEHIAAAFNLSGWASVPVALAVIAGLIALSILSFRLIEYPLNRMMVKRLGGKH